MVWKITSSCDRGVCWLHLPSTPVSTCVSHTHTQATADKQNKKLRKPHFLCQLKGKISRFPQQINSNEWFIICLKHGSSWMWSFWPPLVGLIHLIITETSGDHSGVEHNLWSECIFTWPRIQSGNIWKHFEQVHPPYGCQLPCGSPVLPHVTSPRCLFMTQRRGAADASGLSTYSWFSSAQGAVWKQKV